MVQKSLKSLLRMRQVKEAKYLFRPHCIQLKRIEENTPIWKMILSTAVNLAVKAMSQRFKCFHIFIDKKKTGQSFPYHIQTTQSSILSSELRTNWRLTLSFSFQNLILITTIKTKKLRRSSKFWTITLERIKAKTKYSTKWCSKKLKSTSWVSRCVPISNK